MTKFTKVLLNTAAILATTVALSATASAMDTTLWKQFQFWTVKTDPSLGNGCFIQAEYSGNDVMMRVGLDAKNRNSYMLLAGSSWSLTPGKTYTLQVKFDNIRDSGWSNWSAGAITMSQGTVALVVPFDNVEIWKAVALGSALHIRYQGRPVIDGNLPGSAQAVGEMLNCQKAMTEAGSPNPFADRAPPSRPASDTNPFQPL